MLKKLLACAAVLLLVLSLAACGKTPADSAMNQTTENASGSGKATDIDPDSMFSDSDFKDVSAETADAVVTLNGSTGTISDPARGTSGAVVTITQKGIYRVSGQSENVTIDVNDESESGNVYLLFDNVSMQAENEPCLRVSHADKVILQSVGKNTLTAKFDDQDASADGAIYAKDDLTLSGSGALTIQSGHHGVVCKNDLKLTGVQLTVIAAAIGLKAGDSVRIADGAVTVDAQHDGIQIENDEKDSVFYLNGDMENGCVTVNAGYDGISVTGSARFDAGSLTVTAGGGAESAKTDGTSQKGVKCDGDLFIQNAALTVSAPDDALNAGGSVTVCGGSLDAATADDGIHADGSITIDGGKVFVSKALEGLEAETITVNGGETVIYASDDGLNAAGGSDSASKEAGPWNDSATGSLNVNGGYLYVNAQGDGLDSNGALSVTGGTVIVEGPTNNGNGALDVGERGGGASITGGTVLALGSSGMAINFSGGSQCAALVALSGSAGDTISVDDGSGFTFTATKPFACAVYASPALQTGNVYTLTAGSNSATLDFTKTQFYSDVFSVGGGPMNGNPPDGNPPGKPPADFNGQPPSDLPDPPPQNGFIPPEGTTPSEKN